MDLAKNTEFWMTNLPEKLKSLPVIHLAIPGSHDSTTYAQDKNSTISPDARSPIQYLKFLEPILKPFLLKWSKTQSVDVMQQLRAGIRYFDLRIAMKSHLQDFYFVHNLYSGCVNSVLANINGFLNKHSSEIVILDCQHFYKLTESDHSRLISHFVSMFGQKLLPFSESMNHITLNYMTQNKYQVILIYRADFGAVNPALWPSRSFPTPWPDTVVIPELISFLNSHLEKRDLTVGFVTQCVLTPTVWFAVKNIFGSLKSRCVVPLEAPKFDWLKQQTPGDKGLNIVISDFIEDRDYQFPVEVINLNRKLYENSIIG